VKDNKNGGTNSKSAGPLPQLRKKEQEPAYDIPDQWRETDGRGYVLRQSQLVYKHAISTIMPSQPVQMFDGEENARES
jgi:hypothetical protein